MARNELANIARFFPSQEAEDMRETAEIGTIDEVRAAIYAAEERMEAKHAI